MRRIYRTLAIAILCGALTCPAVEARGRNNNNGGGGTEPARTHTTAPTKATARRDQQAKPKAPAATPQRPGNNGLPAGTNSQAKPRPNNGAGNQGNRPGGHQPGNNNRPGQQPGGQHQPSHQPGHQPVPGHQHGPGYGHQHGPGPIHGFEHIYGAPVRPLMPPPAPFSRPVPPPRFTPVRVPMFSTILGLTLGTALNISLNSLINSGYSVGGYNNDAIYLNNVSQLNMLWPNATLYYTNGILGASEYAYSTPYYDTMRYNQAYNILFNSFGAPIQNQMYSGGGMSASWWGPNGQYVTLNYTPQRAANGALRYYTILSFGI